MKLNSISFDPGRRGARMGVLLATALLLLLAAAGLGTRTALAIPVTQTLNVNSTADLNDVTTSCPGTCTLRKAIDTANNDSGDTINVPAGTYTLTTHQDLQIRAAMNIVGADPRTTIIDGGSANQSDNRIFDILANPIDTSISNLTLQHVFCTCEQGGAIFNTSTGTLTLTNDAIVDNHLQDGTPSWGAGLYNGNPNGGTSHAVITRTLFARNIADITNTSGSVNPATNPAKGGGIYNRFPSVLSVTNSTFNLNTADNGGGIYNQGTATLVNDTISGNKANLIGANTPTPGGGGVVDENPDTVTLTNTIVAENVAGNLAAGNTPSDCLKENNFGTFTSGGNNIDSDGTCFLTGTGDKPNTNPNLAALALNAPGQTSTMAITATSAAYNAAGSAACPATDQRGVSRPQQGACDIGAYELILVASPVASTSAAVTPALPPAGSTSNGGSPGPGAGLVLALVALLLAPLAVSLARRRHPDDGAAR